MNRKIISSSITLLASLASYYYARRHRKEGIAGEPGVGHRRKLAAARWVTLRGPTELPTAPDRRPSPCKSP